MPTNDLIDFMDSLTREIGDEYRRIQKRASEDPGTAGDQGEENWATILRNWLPPAFQIVTKGRILSHDGLASPQVDILILRPEYPKQLLDKKLFLAGGVLAAFECKLSLKASHIGDFIKTSIHIKSHQELRTGTPFRELQSPILFGLLAHSHSWKGDKSTPISNISDKLIELDKSLVEHPRLMPDLLCVADLAFWNTSKMVFLPPVQSSFKNNLDPQLNNGYATSAYIGYTYETQGQSAGFTPIGSMITALLRKLAWEYPSLRQLSGYFTQTNIQGGGNGVLRKWSHEIYSKEMLRNIGQGQTIKNGVMWDEWSLAIY